MSGERDDDLYRGENSAISNCNIHLRLIFTVIVHSYSQNEKAKAARAKEAAKLSEELANKRLENWVSPGMWPQCILPEKKYDDHICTNVVDIVYLCLKPNPCHKFESYNGVSYPRSLAQTICLSVTRTLSHIKV